MTVRLDRQTLQKAKILAAKRNTWISGLLAQPASELLGEVEYSATNYFGNEGGEAAFYVSATLLLEVPPARGRAVTRAPRHVATPKAAKHRRGRRPGPAQER